MKIKPVVLIILDGWGVAPPSEGNAILKAKTPFLDSLIKTYPAMTLRASGEEVGLSWGEMGNSEVGHLNLGAGKIFYQSLPRINKAINDGDFFKNKVFLKACEYVRRNKSKLHLLGLVSSGGVHSHEDHLYALLELAKKEKVKEVFIHAFLDGRDTIYNSGFQFIEKLQKKIKELKIGEIATLSGRFYAMDRDNHWDRTEKVYLALTEGKSEDKFENPLKAIKSSYDKKIYDEEYIPVVITKKGEPIAKIENRDVIIFFNFRADRARQLTKSFVLPEFDQFKRDYLKNLFFATMTEYEKGLSVKTAFLPEIVEYPLARIISDHGLSQLHIAETEKYAHVTFFFNGLKEKEFSREERIIIPSPRVSSYDQKPEMSAKKITERVLQEINKDKFDFVVINFANGDMISHTGKIKATIKAVEIIDKCVGEIADFVLAKKGAVIITADHGNAEELVNIETGKMDKEHSTNPVPFILIGEPWEGKTGGLAETVSADLSLITPQGLLSDVAPTILKIMGIKKSKEMTGVPLI